MTIADARLVVIAEVAKVEAYLLQQSNIAGISAADVATVTATLTAEINAASDETALNALNLGIEEAVAFVNTLSRYASEGAANQVFLGRGGGFVGVGTGGGDAKEALHIQASGTSGYEGAKRGVLVTDAIGPRFVMEDTGETAGNRVMVWKYESQIMSLSGMADNGLSFDVENIISASRDGNVGIGVGGGVANDRLHVRVSGTSGLTSALQRGVLITDAIGPRLTWEDTGEGVDAKAFIADYFDQALSFRALNDIGSAITQNNILVLHRDGRVAIGAVPLDASKLLIEEKTDQGRLLRFETERAWVVKQDGTGASTALTFQSLNNQKNLNIQDSVGNNLASFLTGTAPDIRLAHTQAIARVGIGTASTPDESAKLEVLSANMGFLTARNADPTANIPTPAEGLGAFNSALKHHESFNGTQWQPIGPPEVVHVTKESQLPAPVGGVITLENKTYIFYSDTGLQKQIDIANRIQFPDSGGCRITSTGLAEALLNYTGTGDFFTTSNNFTGFVTIDNIFISAPTGTLFNFSGVLPVGQEFFPRAFFYAMGFFNTDTIGTFKNISFNFNIGAFFSCKQGIVFENMFETLISDVRFIAWQNEPGSVMITLKGGQTFPKIAGGIFKVGINETLFDIQPNLPDADVLVFAANGVSVDGTAFKPGVSGAFTAVFNASDDGLVIDSISGTPFGETVFETAAPHGLVLGQVITTSGFTDPNYNGTFTVLELPTSTSFRVHTLFTATGAGVFATDLLQFNSTAHGLLAGDAITITDSTVPSYDGGATVLIAAADAFHINRTGGGDATGNWNTDSLTQDDKRVEFAGNSGLADSINLGFAEANPAAPVATTGFVIDTYQALVVTGLADNAESSRFELTDATAGIYTFRGNKAITGRLLANIWATKSGLTRNYRFAPSVNDAVIDFATAKFAPMEVKAAKVQATLGSRVALKPGDTVQVKIAPAGHADDLTITDFNLDIEG